MRALILFDIDGTLLTSAAAGRAAVERAFSEEYDDLSFFDQVRFDGKTDPQIVRELHLAAGNPERATDSATAEVLARYIRYLEDSLAERRDSVLALPGIADLLQALEKIDDVCVGLLTGNVLPGARLKLDAAGLPFTRFRVGAYGSDSGHRPDLPAIAVERANEFFEHPPEGEQVVIIGDTPADVTCGEAIGVRSIAVATGSYSVSDLAEAGASHTFETLENTDAAVEAMLC